MINDFINQNQLTHHYFDAVDDYILPIVDTIINQLKSLNKKKTILVAISAPQGSGKSTLAQCLKLLFADKFIPTEVISLDDFYLSKSSREKLAQKIHPLLNTRGVPGTHQIDLLINCLIDLKKGKTVTLPQFDKMTDDSLPSKKIIPTPIIILEGWCVGWGKNDIPPPLSPPINQLEAQKDDLMVWRNFVESQRKKYKALNPLIDFLIYLKIPNFNLVWQWREKQELKLSQQKNNQTKKKMSSTEIKYFVQYFERVTKELMTCLPQTADLVLNIDANHCFQGISDNTR